MLNNFLQIKEIIETFYNCVIKQIKKYETIKNRFSENVISYSNFLIKTFDASNSKCYSSYTFKKNNLSFFEVNPSSDYLLFLSETLQQDIFLYCKTFNKNIYVIANKDKITKIFDLNINNKPDNCFYDAGEDVDDFVNEALKELQKKEHSS